MRLTVEEKKNRLFHYGYDVMERLGNHYGKSYQVGKVISRLRHVGTTPMKLLRAIVKAELKK